MNNPPFSIGQKVVSLKTFNPNPDNGRVPQKGEVLIYDGCIFSITGHPFIFLQGFDYLCIKGDGERINFNSKFFAPVETRYNDSTAEILEKFKSPAETPDKILTPEKVKV